MLRKEYVCESLRNTLACDVRDWSSYSKDAWIYGIIVGWDEAALAEVAKKHGWSPQTVKRLRALREGFKSLETKEG